MSLFKLALRSLVHYWRSNIAIVLCVGVAVAVLTGSLVVGDSFKGSLRSLALQRLGEIDHAVIAGNFFFREQLADDLLGPSARRLDLGRILGRGQRQNARFLSE